MLQLFYCTRTFLLLDLFVQEREISAGCFLQEFPQLVPSRRQEYYSFLPGWFLLSQINGWNVLYHQSIKMFSCL
jgi:hypothetical protein